MRLQQQLYDLELARIPILAAGRRVRDEQDEIYRRIAAARGLAPDAVLINMTSGEVRVRREDVAAPRKETESPVE